MSEATLSAPLFFQKQFERLTSFLCCSLYLRRRRGHSAEEGAPRRASLSSGVSRGGKVSRHIHTEIPLFPLTVRETPAQVPDPASKEEPQNLLREPCRVALSLALRARLGSPPAVGRGCNPLALRVGDGSAVLSLRWLAGTWLLSSTLQTLSLPRPYTFEMSETWCQQYALLCRHPSWWLQGVLGAVPLAGPLPRGLFPALTGHRGETDLK